MRSGIALLPHVLYRFYDAESALLYIGITVDEGARWLTHTKTQWWSQVARVEIEQQPDRASALAAEKDAIKTESPRYNVVHNVAGPKVQDRLNALLEKIESSSEPVEAIADAVEVAVEEAAPEESPEVAGEVAVDVVPAPDDVAEWLKISPGAPIVRCLQVFYRDGEPSMVKLTYIPTGTLVNRNRSR